MKVVKSKDFLQPKDVLEKHPNCGWTVYQIGHLVGTGIIAGYKPRGGTCYLIYEPSFVALMEYKKGVERVVVDYSS